VVVRLRRVRPIAAGSGLADAGFDAGLDRKVQPFRIRGMPREDGGERREVERREKRGARRRRAECCDSELIRARRQRAEAAVRDGEPGESESGSEWRRKRSRTYLQPKTWTAGLVRNNARKFLQNTDRIT
jgi:hypothetical protein